MESIEDYFERLASKSDKMEVEGPLPYTHKEFEEWSKYRTFRLNIHLPDGQTTQFIETNAHKLKGREQFFAPEDNLQQLEGNILRILSAHPSLAEVERHRVFGGWLAAEYWLIYRVEFLDIIPTTSSVATLTDELKRALIYAKVEQKASVLVCTEVSVDCILEVSEDSNYIEWLHGTVGVRYARVQNKDYYSPGSYGYYETKLSHLASKPQALRVWAEELDLALLTPEESVKVMSDAQLLPYATKRPWWQTLDLIAKTVTSGGRRELVRRLREIEEQVTLDRADLRSTEEKYEKAEGDYSRILSFIISSLREKVRFWPEDTDLAFMRKSELSSLYSGWLERQPIETIKEITEELHLSKKTRQELEKDALKAEVRLEKSDAQLHADLKRWMEDRYLESFI